MFLTSNSVFKYCPHRAKVGDIHASVTGPAVVLGVEPQRK